MYRSADIDVLSISGSGIDLRTGSAIRRRTKLTIRSAPVSRSTTRQTEKFAPVRRLSSWTCAPNPPRESPPMCLDDVVNLMDLERARSSYQSRRHILAEAQKQVRHDGPLSRPMSSYSCHSVHRTTPRSPQSRLNSADSVIHPNSPCMDDLQAATIEQCCEVMGPSLCRECNKLSSRNANRRITESSFPGLKTSHQNVITAALVKQLFPRLSRSEIQNMVDNGEVGKTTFLNYLRGERGEAAEKPKLDKSDSSDPSTTTTTTTSSSVKKTEQAAYIIAKLKMKMKHFGKASTPLYFSNVRDLNYKLMKGTVSRDMVKYKPRKNSIWLNMPKNDDPSGDSLRPAFVSPRKVKMIEEPSYKVYYGPPLLAKESQHVNPSFFAGSDQEYKLPERLPDKLERVDSASKQHPGISKRTESRLSLLSSLSDDQV